MNVPLELLSENLKRTCYELSRMAQPNGYLAGGLRSVSGLLAVRCGYTEKTAKRHLKRLIQAGWLECQKHTATSGASAPNLYRFKH